MSIRTCVIIRRLNTDREVFSYGCLFFIQPSTQFFLACNLNVQIQKRLLSPTTPVSRFARSIRRTLTQRLGGYVMSTSSDVLEAVDCMGRHAYSMRNSAVVKHVGIVLYDGFSL